MKSHPGIVFSIWSIVILFLLGIWYACTTIPDWIARSIYFFIAAECFWGMMYYHGQWLIKLDKKYYKIQKLKDNLEKEKWVL